MIRRLRRSAFFSALLLLLVALAFPLARRASMQETAPSCAQVPSGIVSWYPADVSTAEDGNAVDIVSRNHGTLENGATFAPGKVGTAFSFDGVDDYIDVPDNQSLEFNTLTIDAWIKRTTTTDARIVDKMTADATDGYALDIVNNHLRLIIGGASVVGTTAIETGTYVLVAGTFDGSVLSVYINGRLDGTTNVESATTPTNNLPLHIGSDSTGSGHLFGGQIDEVELFNRALKQPEIQSLFDADSAGKCRGSEGGQLIISEFRFRGPGSPAQNFAASASQGGSKKPAYAVDPNGYDEFIELYNNSESAIRVATTDGSAGWALAAEQNLVSSNRVLGVIPNGTVIPARTRYLFANADGYSLGNYPAGPGTTATPDQSYDAFDIPDDGGVALFSTADVTHFSEATRLDAAGFAPPGGNGELRAGGGKIKPSAVDPLYREGEGILNPVTASVEHSFIRVLFTGKPQDTDNNANDFQLVATNPDGLTGAILGAPGPENSSSPHRGLIKAALIDPCVSSSSSPNRSRDVEDSVGSFGSLTIRRRFINFGDQPVTKLRFRVIDITTKPAPDGQAADLRARDSSAGPLQVTGTSCTGNTQITVQGLTLEQPPSQPNGGALNSTLAAGTITLQSPLAAGDSIPLQFRLGVEQTGFFRFFVIIEQSSDTGRTAATANVRVKQKLVTGEHADVGGTTTKVRVGAKSQTIPRIRN
jgi:hypothetical protein